MVNTPIPHSLRAESRKAAKILQDFTMPSAKTGPDKIIPGFIVNQIVFHDAFMIFSGIGMANMCQCGSKL